MQYGAEACELVSDDYITFKTGCFKGIANGFLGQIMQQKGRMDTQCLLMLSTLIEIMLENDEIAEYVYNLPSPTMQGARYTDFFFTYFDQLKAATLNATKNTNTIIEYHRTRLVLLEQLNGYREAFEAKVAPWAEAQKA